MQIIELCTNANFNEAFPHLNFGETADGIPDAGICLP